MFPFSSLPHSKHGEPLRLYCTEPVCQAPICTVCKTTLGHDGHVAIELDEQAVTESHSIQALMGALQRSVSATTTKVQHLNQLGYNKYTFLHIFPPQMYHMPQK